MICGVLGAVAPRWGGGGSEKHRRPPNGGRGVWSEGGAPPF